MAYEKMLMEQYSQHLHLFTPICYITANAVAFGYEANMPAHKAANKSQQDIARDKAMAQAQTQCFMKGGDFVLSLRCEFSGDSEVSVCNFVGCVASRREMACESVADDKEYDEIVDDIELSMENESVTSSASWTNSLGDSSESMPSSIDMDAYAVDAYAMFAQC